VNPTDALATALHEVGWIDTGYPPAYDGNARFILAALPPGWALVDMEDWRTCLRDAALEAHTMGLIRDHGDTFAGCGYPVCAEARRLLGLEP